MTGVIGIAIGGTKVAVSHAFYDGIFQDIKKITFPCSPDNPMEVMVNIFDAISKINRDFRMISVICGGPLNIKKGVISSPPHLPGFKDFPIVKVLKEKYGCPVYLLNDADAAALAEFRFGAGVGSKNMAYLTFGTGIGAGLILNGKLFTGNNGMAGEIGHVKLSDDGPVGYGKVGSVEGYCAGGNIPIWTKEMMVDRPTLLNKYDSPTTKDIVYEAGRGDPLSLEVLDKVAYRLGQTISILVDILNLDRVVIGGIYTRCEELLKDKVLKSFRENGIKENCDVCEIVASKLKEQIDEYSSLVGVSLMEVSFYDRYVKLLPQKDNIEKAIDELEKCYKNGGKILVCGNGGSASDAAHIVGELMKSFVEKRPLEKDIQNKLESEFKDGETSSKLQKSIPAIDLGAQTALNTAFANDVDPELIFAQQVIGYSSNNKNDVLIAISTSGNSRNVVNAVKAAKAIGLKTIALTGENESELSGLATICIKAPANETYKVQEYHLPIYHYICIELEKRI